MKLRKAPFAEYMESSVSNIRGLRDSRNIPLGWSSPESSKVPKNMNDIVRCSSSCMLLKLPSEVFKVSNDRR